MLRLFTDSADDIITGFQLSTVHYDRDAVVHTIQRSPQLPQSPLPSLLQIKSFQDFDDPVRSHVTNTAFLHQVQRVLWFVPGSVLQSLVTLLVLES